MKQLLTLLLAISWFHSVPTLADTPNEQETQTVDVTVTNGSAAGSAKQNSDGDC
jgi:hypothetical protein